MFRRLRRAVYLGAVRGGTVLQMVEISGQVGCESGLEDVFQGCGWEMRLKLALQNHLSAIPDIALALDTGAGVDASKAEILEAAGTVDVFAGRLYRVFGFRPADSALSD